MFWPSIYKNEEEVSRLTTHTCTYYFNIILSVTLLWAKVTLSNPLRSMPRSKLIQSLFICAKNIVKRRCLHILNNTSRAFLHAPQLGRSYFTVRYICTEVLKIIIIVYTKLSPNTAAIIFMSGCSIIHHSY